MMTTMDFLTLSFLVLAFLQAQIALILSALAYLQSRPTQSVWEASEEDLLELDKERARKQVEEARRAEASKPRTFTEFKHEFEELMRQ